MTYKTKKKKKKERFSTGNKIAGALATGIVLGAVATAFANKK